MLSSVTQGIGIVPPVCRGSAGPLFRETGHNAGLHPESERRDGRQNPRRGRHPRQDQGLPQPAANGAAKNIIALAKSYGIDPGPPPDGCVRCRLCIRVCKEIVGPAALKMEKRDGMNYVVPIEGLCIGCGTCANICPTKVIAVEDKESMRTISIRDEVIGRHPLERCEGCGKLFATPRFLDHIHKRTAGHTDVKAHHNYCPTCAKLFSDRIRSFSERSQK